MSESSESASVFLTALVADLALVVEGLAGAPVVVASGSGVSGKGWNVPLTVTGSPRGTVRLTVDAAGAERLVHAILGAEADAGEPATIDLLREIVTQTGAALSLKPSFSKASIAVGAITASQTQPDQTASFVLSLGKAGVVEIAAGATLESAVGTASPPGQNLMSRPASDGAAMGALPMGNLEVVLDIELPLSVRFGSSVMSIRALSTLGPGSIVDMGRSPDDPVEILVCGRVVAKAEVVIVGGNYGVRITDLTSTAERIRALEGQW